MASRTEQNGSNEKTGAHLAMSFWPRANRNRAQWQQQCDQLLLCPFCVAFSASWSTAYLCALAAKYGAENILLFLLPTAPSIIFFFGYLYIIIFEAYLLHKQAKLIGGAAEAVASIMHSAFLTIFMAGKYSKGRVSIGSSCCQIFFSFIGGIFRGSFSDWISSKAVLNRDYAFRSLSVSDSLSFHYSTLSARPETRSPKTPELLELRKEE